MLKRLSLTGFGREVLGLLGGLSLLLGMSRRGGRDRGRLMRIDCRRRIQPAPSHTLLVVLVESAQVEVEHVDVGRVAETAHRVLLAAVLSTAFADSRPRYAERVLVERVAFVRSLLLLQYPVAALAAASGRSGRRCREQQNARNNAQYCEHSAKIFLLFLF